MLLTDCLSNGADLADHNPSLHRRVLDRPGDCIPPFCEALEDYIRNQAPKVLEGGGGIGGEVIFGNVSEACICADAETMLSTASHSSGDPYSMHSHFSALQLLEEGQRVHIGFSGEFGPHTVTPRELSSEVRRLGKWWE